MTAPLPGPPDTALLEYADLHIRALALAADAKMSGGQTRFAMLKNYDGTSASYYTTNANGDITVTFAGFSKPMAGCIVVPGSSNTIDGQVTVLPPVPPASIGRTIPRQPYLLVVLALNPAGNGTAWVRAYTRPWVGTPQNGQPQQMGSQPAAAGQLVCASGIAWGPT